MLHIATALLHRTRGQPTHSRTVAAPTQSYVSLAFSPDGKMLAAQGGAPEWNLVLWVWEKTKVGAMIKSTNQQASPIYQLAFNPSDASLLTCAGSQIFKSFRVSEVALAPHPGS
jgi:WD40 repeat protein